MQRKLVLEFTKMNGAGNDFIVIDNRFYNFAHEELVELARNLCPRRTGVGADGLLVFLKPDNSAHHYRMRYYNADGSLATMCGNGARCLARFARQAGITDEEMFFESDAGLYRATAGGEPGSPVRIYVQPPEDYRPQLELTGFAVNGSLWVDYLWSGTEHVVLFVEDTARADVATLGPAIRAHETLGPAGANVNFVSVLSRGNSSEPAELQVRTFEKGVEGETLACGTGAIASAVVASFTDKIQALHCDVSMPGGRLSVGFLRDGEAVSDVYLEGPADTVYRGTVEV